MIPLCAGGVPHTIGKFLTTTITLLHTSPQSKVCTQSYGTPKSRESQLWEFQDSHLGVLGQNDIWVLVPWPCTKYIIRGKVMASPKSGPWWVLWICVCLWFICAPKVLQLCTNQFVVWFLCKYVWVIELFVNLLSPHPRVPTRPFTPKMLQTKECAPTPFPSVVFILGLVVSPSKSLGVRHIFIISVLNLNKLNTTIHSNIRFMIITNNQNLHFKIHCKKVQKQNYNSFHHNLILQKIHTKDEHKIHCKSL
jgi:hypothetical protein